eukprot:jgi/Psemu1/55554/gm1.55554_g
MSTKLSPKPSSPRSTLDTAATRAERQCERTQGLEELKSNSKSSLSKINDDGRKLIAVEKYILFGRGYVDNYDRPPNIHFRRVVDAFRDEYNNSAGHQERTKIVCKVIELLRQDGYSFLMQHRSASTEIVNNSSCNSAVDEGTFGVEDHNSWMSVSNLEVQKEVTRLFRRCSSRRSHNCFSDDVNGMGEQQKQRREVVAFNNLNGSSRVPVSAMGAPTHQNPKALLSTHFLSQYNQQVPRYDESGPSPSVVTEQSLLHYQHNLSTVQMEQSSAQASCPVQKQGNGVSLSHHDGRVWRKDGLLWSKGSKTISLLEGMDRAIIPTESYSLISSIEDQAFGKDACAAEPSPALGNGDPLKGMGSTTTIGYTYQKAGHVTIIRPIILLPGNVNARAPPTGA